MALPIPPPGARAAFQGPSLDAARIRAVSMDLDDTLWPVRPTIERAERVLRAWLAQRAPSAAARYADPAAMRVIRDRVARERPAARHDLSALRRESLRLALADAGDDPRLADPAFEVFLAERQNVTFFPDALPALEALAERYRIVGLTNGNADLGRIGLAGLFVASVSPREAGVAKPDPRIFHAAAAAAGVEPHAVLHVGDDALVDVLGARGAGMQAAWVNRAGATWPHAEPPPELEVATLAELSGALASSSTR